MKAALLLAGIMLGAALIVAPSRKVAAHGSSAIAPYRPVPKVPNRLTGLALVADRRRFVDPFAGEALATLN